MTAPSVHAISSDQIREQTFLWLKTSLENFPSALCPATPFFKYPQPLLPYGNGCSRSDMSHFGALADDATFVQIISPLQEAVAWVQGLSSGLWFEVWDIPCILKQMDLSEIVLVHQPPQDLIQSQQSHLPAVVQPLASETWRLLSIASQPSLKPACNSALSHCSGKFLPLGFFSNRRLTHSLKPSKVVWPTRVSQLPAGSQ